MRLLSCGGRRGFIAGGLSACSAGGSTLFSTPEGAVKALVKAVQEGKTESVLAIVGPELKDALQDVDKDLLKLERELFLLAAKRSVKIEKEGSDSSRAIAYFGEQEWPFPFHS